MIVFIRILWYYIPSILCEVILLADKNNKSRFKLFDLQKEGPGISKRTADMAPGFKRFFISFKDNFDKIMYANIFMVLGNFPIAFAIIAFSGYSQAASTIPMYDIFQNLAVFFNVEPPSAYYMSLYTVLGLQNQVLVPVTATYILYGLSALTLLTFGVVNVGTAYILRNIAMGEPVFTWTDFWYAIKRNWKQALPLGIIDVIINVVLVVNIYNMVIIQDPTYFESFMLWANIIIFLIYFFMRYYMYIQMVTFDLSIGKILKNSLIFTLLGLKRNLVALIGIILGIALEVFFVLGLGGILVPVGVALPLLIMFSGFAYMKVYAAYFKIKEVMIDPYKAAHPDPVIDEDEIIMRDDVTERERLAEIKRRNGIVDEDDEY